MKRFSPRFLISSLFSLAMLISFSLGQYYAGLACLIAVAAIIGGLR